MKKRYFAVVIFTAGFLSSQVAQQILGIPTIITRGDAALTLGKTKYPSAYGYSDSVYLVLDKESEKDDATIVLREAGNARAELGLVQDNDFHIKTVTGNYGEELFTDRFLVRATGEVDGVGKILRQYATDGTPTIAVGDSDGESSGSGLEMSFNQFAGVGKITSISRGVAFRQLDFSGSGYSFYAGDKEVGADPVVSITSDGLKTDGVVGVGTYTLETLPHPVAGGIVYVSDGADGSPVLAYSDGSVWLRSDTLAAISEPIVEEDPIDPDEENGDDPETLEDEEKPAEG